MFHDKASSTVDIQHLNSKDTSKKTCGTNSSLIFICQIKWAKMKQLEREENRRKPREEGVF